MHLPEPLGAPDDLAVQAIQEWVTEQGLTMSQLRSANRQPRMVEARRRVCSFLHAHGWATTTIGHFIQRDHTTVGYLLRGESAG